MRCVRCFRCLSLAPGPFQNGIDIRHTDGLCRVNSPTSRTFGKGINSACSRENNKARSGSESRRQPDEVLYDRKSSGKVYLSGCLVYIQRVFVMSRLYCIGDVHGCAQTLSDLLTLIPLERVDRIVFLGDYIDRGPDSRGVVDQLLDLRRRGFDVTTLMGNHEHMFMESEEESDIECWEDDCGGLQTLHSFSISRYSELASPYREFFEQLGYHSTIDGHIFVHAGLDFSGQKLFDNRYAMLWSRQTDVDPRRLGRKRIIHGHTPQPCGVTELQRQRLKTHRILNIDNGCVFHHIEGLGHLTAYEVSENRLFHVPNRDIR